jgi:hypothetical protein
VREKRWKPISWANCIHCGSDDVEVLTDLNDPENPEYVYDGDEARCRECHCPGLVLADEDYAHVDWHDEPNCNCEWCEAHPITEEPIQ